MPWKRVGKTVYKKNPDGSLGKSVGTSSSVNKAKAHLKALYANAGHAVTPPKPRKKKDNYHKVR